MDLEFKNARRYLLEEVKTISGLDDKYGWLEVYRGEFCDKLDLLGITSDEDYSSILTRMNKYSSVGNFLYDANSQLAELSAFGLILFDRLSFAEANEMTYDEFFGLHQELFECYLYVKQEGSEAKTRQALATIASNARHIKNRADKDKVFAWCDLNMKRFEGMDAAAADIAETFIPQKFRAVRDWMTEWKKLRSASTP